MHGGVRGASQAQKTNTSLSHRQIPCGTLQAHSHAYNATPRGYSDGKLNHAKGGTFFEIHSK
jgi:hypothetical protein